MAVGDEIIIDNLDPGFSTTSFRYYGGYSTSQAYNGNMHYANPNEIFTTTWTPGVAATYDIYTSWPADSNRPTVTYVVHHAGGTDSINVNQYLMANQVTYPSGTQWSGWSLLGTFDFDGSSYLSMTTPGVKYAIMDASKFVEVSSGPAVCTDLDGDNYGNPGSAVCSAGSDEDCDDNDASINPGATEVCNNVDDNCDGTVDEGFDQDGDGVSDCYDNCPTVPNPGQDAGACQDTDGDTIPDSVDNCLNVPNTNQEDSDGTGDYAFEFDIEPPTFRNPVGIGSDSQDNFYVADTEHNKVIKFDSDGTLLFEITSVSTPLGVITDSLDNVYVVNYGSQLIKKYDSSGNYILQWGSSGTFDIAADSNDNIYAIQFTGSIGVKKFSSNGNLLTQWGSSGSEDGQFNNPNGIGVNSLDEVYVTEASGNRVQKFTSDGTFIVKRKHSTSLHRR